MKNWHRMEIAELLHELNTDPQTGLNDAEVSSRIEEYGPNELVDRGTKSPWKILWEQLTGTMVVILIISALISIFLQEYKDAIAILVIVVLNALLGFTQEFRAEQAMAALKKMAVPHVRVKRNGHLREISAQTLVPGDVILLEAGNAIPADCRLIESANLRAQEAVLTGESEPTEKSPEPITKENSALADRHNMLYMGTAITYGRGTAVITGTGMDTELGHIADMIQNVGQEATPLQRRLDQLGKNLALAALGIVAVVFILGVIRGEELRLMFMTSISMAVAAVPEGLPAVVTIALALGAQRMLKRNALIRKLPAVETLGSVTVICSDKTGTLTENKMTVTMLDVAGNQLDVKERLRDFSPSVGPVDNLDPILLENPAISMLLAGGALCNDAILEPSSDRPGEFTAIGDPTEGALVIAAARAGLWKEALETAYPRVAELPFDSDRKRMTTLHKPQHDQLTPGMKQVLSKLEGLDNNIYLALTKGSVDGLLDISDRVFVNNRPEAMNASWRSRIETTNNQIAQNGMRVLGVAFRECDSSRVNDPNNPVEQNLIFVGMIGMIDPARREAKEAVLTAQQAGIRPVMITGDHPLTALHIARELEITQQGKVITGQDLAVMSVEDLEKQVEDISVYARVSPEHKLKIVQALQDKGHIVAMTGDGVNDAPALKKADIGVAMGITGTDVSKEAADMVLLDDNFATIIASVEEGRRIYDNIRKFIRYTMTSNAGEIWVMLLGPFLMKELPLLPLQILWVNLVTDGLPGLALTIEPAESNTMKRPPYPPKESIFGRGMIGDILWIGLLMGIVSLGIGFWAYTSGHLQSWQTMVFTTLTLSQMGNALAIRSERDSLFKIGVFSNKLLIGAILLTLILQLAVIYHPFMQNIFKTVSLTPMELGISLVSSTLVFIGVEVKKWLVRKKPV